MKSSEFHRRVGVLERKYRRAMEYLEAKNIIDKVAFVVKPEPRKGTVFIQTFFTHQGNSLRQDWEYVIDGEEYFAPRVGVLRTILEGQTKEYLRSLTA
jgi:hypothetical protein